MALDGLVLHAIIHELQAFVGGRISKIQQPDQHDIILQLRSQGHNGRLLISANPTYPRVHFTEHQFMNPMEAPMFCMLLRKHCEGGVIESIQQVGMERIVHIDVRQRDELGDLSVKRIIIEIMGRHSNIVLLDTATNTILDGIHHVTPAISSFRVVLPGCAYLAPPDQEKHNPLITTQGQFLSIMTSDTASDYDQAIVQQFSGISPLVAKEIIYRSGLISNLNLAALHSGENLLNEFIWPVFKEAMEGVTNHKYQPAIVEAETGKSYFSIMPLTHIPGESTIFSTISSCLEAFYGDKAERDAVKQRVADLLRFLQNEKSKNIKKLEKLHETIKEAEAADKHRIQGELLTAHMHQIQRGMKSIEVVNYYDENQKTVVIPLDPLLSPSENAQKYFKKYNKSKNRITVVQQQIQNTHEEISYIDGLQQQLNNASMQDIAEIREELVEQGYIRDRSKSKRKKKKINKPVISCFVSSEGIDIYVGKNNIQNEYITNRLAQSSDTWLHTKDMPGSHVVIRSTAFGDNTLQEAAQLAAYYSQGKQSSHVPVDYTFIRHVRKPNGAKPGFVIYDHQKTLFITPDEAFIKQLKVSVK
ncbi:MAG TPA: NFACT RNA binding domain-containing protein [Bacilli bacterium]